MPNTNGFDHPMDKFLMEPFKGGVPQEGNPFTLDEKLTVRVMIPGKIHPSQGGLFIAYGGKEHAYQSDYEILVTMH